jgi:phosphoribosylformylglycinamidine synthase
MAKIIVNVMLKNGILDPQGDAIHAVMKRLGFTPAVKVRQGKRFEIECLHQPTEEEIKSATQIAESLLSNSVIENFEILIEG